MSAGGAGRRGREPIPLLVLGSGYLGTALAALAPGATHTSRTPERRQPGRRWLRFDADEPGSWTTLAGLAAAGIVVAFPLHPRLDLAGLWTALGGVSGRVVVIGTTSSFEPVAGVVSDDSPLDPADPRAAAEDSFRRCGAFVLHAAGIYGPERNPVDWLRRGRIANAGKLVNLVHVVDLARACVFVLDRFVPAGRAVVSDGAPRSWAAIVAHAVARGWIADPRLPETDDPASKRVVPRLLRGLGFALDHPDLLAELDLLEGG